MFEPSGFASQNPWYPLWVKTFDWSLSAHNLHLLAAHFPSFSVSRTKVSLRGSWLKSSISLVHWPAFWRRDKHGDEPTSHILDTFWKEKKWWQGACGKAIDFQNMFYQVRSVTLPDRGVNISRILTKKRHSIDPSAPERPSPRVSFGTRVWSFASSSAAR